MLRRAVSDRAPGSESDLLPAITLDVDPTDAGLQQMTAQLTAFARDHALPDPVGSRLVSVASDVADVVTSVLGAPPLARLRAEADIGDADAQLVVSAGDERLVAAYGSLRALLDRIAPRCDRFMTELAPNAELLVWACFRLA
jgi:hypothetical protein